MDRVALAIRFMALFSLATGALVLIGALATSRFQRIREGALLRDPGRHPSAGPPDRAGRIPVARLCWRRWSRSCSPRPPAGRWPASCSTGSFSLPVLPMSGLGAAVVVLTVVVGLANSRDVVRRPPLEVLREE